MALTLHQFVMGLAEAAFKTHVEPKLNKAPLWDNGVGKLTEGIVTAAGVPQYTGDQIAAGILHMMGVGVPRVKRGYDPNAPGQGPVINMRRQP